jgi:hypothetical protein
MWAMRSTLTETQIDNFLINRRKRTKRAAECILETVAEKECEDLEAEEEEEEEEDSSVQCKTPELGTQPYQPRTKFRRRRRPVFNKGIVDEMCQW